jgi:hypothetical protein
MKSFPPFPEPNPAIADELQKACPKNKCTALYDWLGKLKVLREQMSLYRGEPNE